MLLSFTIQTYLCAKGRNEPSGAVVKVDGAGQIVVISGCFSTHVDIDDYRSRGVKRRRQIFFELIT